MNELLFPCNPTVGEVFQRWTWNGKQWVTIGRGSGFAPLNSPDFSGMPTGPTPEPGSSDAKLATTAFVMHAIAAMTAGVASFNTRTGHVTLSTVDIVNAGGAPIDSPHFLGQPEADTAPPGTATRVLATTEFVTDAIAARLTDIVDSFNGRTGDVTLRWEDVQAVGAAPLRDAFFLGIPRAVTPPATDNSTRIATTEYVTRAFAAELHVTSFNQRTGNVVFRASDLSAVGGAFLASPHFTGVPTAPTAPPHTSSDQLATTRYVDAAIASNPGPPGPPGQRGPEGPPGPNGRGMEVVGSVPAVGDLPMTGNIVGDIYMVGTPPTDGWFWDGAQWLPLGNIQGAQGPAGPAGPAGPLPTPVGINGAIQFNDNGVWGARPDFWITPLGSLNVGRFINVAFGGIVLTDTPGGILFNSWPTNFIVAQQAGVHQWAVTLGNNDGNFSIDRYPTGVGGGPDPVLTIDFPTGRIIPNRNSLTAPSAISLQPRPFASLPAASLYWGGAHATVNDALSLTGVVQGGGANIIPVFCDGTAWRAMTTAGVVALNQNNVMDPFGVIGWGPGRPALNWSQLNIPGALASTVNSGNNIYGMIEFMTGSQVTFTTTTISFPNLPTTNPAIVGRLWNNGGVLTISAG